MKSNIVLYSLFCLVALFSCGQKKESPKLEEDVQAKKTLQGIWNNEDEGDAAFYFKGDTAYYPLGEGEPVAFYVSNDSIHFKTSRPTGYPIKVLSDKSFRFINAEGDQTNLVKSTNKNDIYCFIERANDTIVINQNLVIKRDTVVNVSDIRQHVYVQVNPHYNKVYKQSINDDGLTVDNAYWDNSVHVCIFVGNSCIYRHNFIKDNFKEYIPADYLKQSILSDITIDKVVENGVQFTAIIAQPDTYSSYNVTIVITKNGKMSMSLQQ